MEIVTKIVDIYENIMPKSLIMLGHREAIEYFERLIMQGNIITYVSDGELQGLLEFWRINYEQFGRLCCNITLAHEEDLLNGNIALISRMWINPSYRNGDVFTILGRQFIDKNLNATYFVAFQNQKKHKPLQVYTREEILRHYK